MSKLGYLLTILTLCVIGYGLSTQLLLTTRTTKLLTAAEVVKHIKHQLHVAYQQLRRFPNGDDEFETLVLDRIKPAGFKEWIVFDHFTPGSRMTPASFELTVKGATITGHRTVRLEYYGYEYEADPFLKGTLRKR